MIPYFSHTADMRCKGRESISENCKSLVNSDLHSAVVVAYLDLIGDKPNYSCLLYEVLAGLLSVLGIEVAQTDGGDQFRMGLRDPHKLDENVQILLRRVLRIVCKPPYL